MSNRTRNHDEEPPPEQLPDELLSMWEIPQIYQFLCLAKDTLNIQHLSMYEMERMMLMPRASKQLAHIMTCLLSPPMHRSKHRKVPSMPYEFWTNVLAHKVSTWHKIYQSKHHDTVKVLEATGVEPAFWTVVKDPELISQKGFEELSLKERVWLLKTVCDTLVHSRRSIQDEVSRNYVDDESEMLLGKDRHGARYIYFPIFLDGDLRVYRHCLENKVLLGIKTINTRSRGKPQNANGKKLVRRKCRTRWKNGGLPNRAKKRSVKIEKIPEVETCSIKAELKIEENEEKVTEVTVESSDNPEVAQESQQVRDDASNCSKTDDEKINEKINEKNGSAINEISDKRNCDTSKSDDEKLDDTKMSEEIETKNQPKYLEDENSNHTFDDTVNNIETKKTSKVDVEAFNSIINDLGVSTFKLVADSISSVTDLIACFSAQNYPENSDTAQCEIQLIKKLTDLINPLKDKESALKESTKKAKSKLQKEWNNFKNGINEDEDGPGDDSGCSNEWVLGSQGCPLLSNGDTSLQTLSQSSLSSPGAADDIQGDKKLKHQDGDEKNNGGIESDESEHETRRVLRTRGVSSYTEQFTSSSESETCQLDEWTGFETIDTTTCQPIPPTTPNSSQRSHSPNSDATDTDSDKDWILPGTRKRKNKRGSGSRRFRNFQQKLSNIKMDSTITTRGGLSDAVDPISTDIKPDINALNNAFGISSPSNAIKMSSVHSELDIKDEGPIIEAENPLNTGIQQNYVLVNAGNGPVNYVVMPHENQSISQQQQSGPIVSVMPQVSMPQGYYVQSPPYIVSTPQMTSYRNPYGESSTLQPMIIQQHPSTIIPPTTNYVQYQPVVGTMPIYQTPGQVNFTQRPIQMSSVAPRGTNRDIQIRPVGPRPNHPDGAVIRSTVPFRGVARKNINPRDNSATPRPTGVRPTRPAQLNSNKKITPTSKATTKTTSLIVLSDSDDEIEVIIPEKCDTPGVKKQDQKQRSIKSGSTVDASSPATTKSKSLLTPQIIKRMNQGGISITPIKPKVPAEGKNAIASGTQLVVVVNETGSHYALALPNGSKLILTPEQVAQIRASNGGKLVL